MQVKTVATDVKGHVKRSLSTLINGLQSSLATATADVAAEGGVVAKVMTAKRRAQQLALQKLGRTEATEDPEFDALVESMYEMKVNLGTLADHLSVFLSAVAGACPSWLLCSKR